MIVSMGLGTWSLKDLGRTSKAFCLHVAAENVSK
jgi:hypothetical protein